MAALLVIAHLTPAYTSGFGSPRTSHARMAVSSPSVQVLPDLDGALPDCPPTVWDADGINIREEQSRYRKEGLPACPLEVVATPEDNAMGAAYFAENSERFRSLLLKHGTIWFKGFDLMKDEVGFRQFYDAIGLSPCLDPIHTSGLRGFASAKDAVYEEVNKKSLAQHYIGLHNEATKKKTAAYGAFVCFKPATVSGGEFFIADGAAIFRDMNPDVLERLYNSKVRPNLPTSARGWRKGRLRLRRRVGRCASPCPISTLTSSASSLRAHCERAPWTSSRVSWRASWHPSLTWTLVRSKAHQDDSRG